MAHVSAGCPDVTELEIGERETLEEESRPGGGLMRTDKHGLTEADWAEVAIARSVTAVYHIDLKCPILKTYSKSPRNFTSPGAAFLNCPWCRQKQTHRDLLEAGMKRGQR